MWDDGLLAGGIDGLMNRGIYDGWIDEWMDERIDRWMEVWIDS